jgi:hypothetical protein
LDHGKLIIKDIPENIPDDSTINSAHVRWSNVADSSRPGYYILNGTFTVSRGGSTQNFKFTKGAYYGAVEFGGALTDVKFAKLDLGEAADGWLFNGDVYFNGNGLMNRVTFSPNVIFRDGKTSGLVGSLQLLLVEYLGKTYQPGERREDRDQNQALLLFAQHG